MPRMHMAQHDWEIFQKEVGNGTIISRLWLGGLYGKPMKAYSKNMRNIYKAVQDLDHQECEKDIKQLNEEMTAFYTEKRQMNEQFETSKRQKTEIIEDDVVSGGEPALVYFS